jgi:hypothetical protein
VKGQNRLHHYPPEACSTFSRNVWSVVRSASLAKGGTSKKRPSAHIHKVPTRSNKMSPRTFQTALVIWFRYRHELRFIERLHDPQKVTVAKLRLYVHEMETELRQQK